MATVFGSINASTTDGNIVSAVSGKKIRVISAIFNLLTSVTPITFNSKPSGAGVAITPAISLSVGTTILPVNGNGWFETAAGEGLTATTGTGQAIRYQIQYEIVM